MNTIAKFTTKHARWITPVFFGLAFYTFGASMMDSFVVSTIHGVLWEMQNLLKCTYASGSRIVPFFVIPTFSDDRLFEHTAILAQAKVGFKNVGMDCPVFYNYSLAFVRIHSNSNANRIRQGQK